MRTGVRLLGVLVLASGLVGWARPALADVDPHDRLKQHLREVVQKVKKAPSAAEKRSILDEELGAMITALDRAEQMGDLSSNDEAGINALRTRLQEKLDELHGHAGFDAVPAGQLDSFADYVQQDFEQANTVTLSITTALLILILIVLLL